MVPHASPPSYPGKVDNPPVRSSIPPKKSPNKTSNHHPKMMPHLGISDVWFNPSPPKKNRQKLIRDRWNIHHHCTITWPQRLLCTARRITKAVLQSSSKLNLSILAQSRVGPCMASFDGFSTGKTSSSSHPSSGRAELGAENMGYGPRERPSCDNPSVEL